MYTEYDHNDTLCHYGVKGMKWGVRKDNNGVSRHTTKLAKKDAKEYARAKMFYGEGAGTRRKLIKAQVAQRSKDVPGYEKEFNKYLDSQDMAKHAVKAKSERRRKTAAKTTAKTTRGIINSALHNGARVSASAASIYAVAHYTGLDEKVKQYAKTSYTKAKDWNFKRKYWN